MTDTIDLISAIVMLLSGLFATLVGFGFIKFKIKNPEDEERMIAWHNKFDKMFKIIGIALLLIGVLFLILITP